MVLTLHPSGGIDDVDLQSRYGRSGERFRLLPPLPSASEKTDAEEGHEALGSSGNRIDPDGVYSERDVVLRLGVGLYTQAKERAAGRLKHTLAGETPVYRGSDLLAWLSSGPGNSSNDPSTRSRAAPAAAVPRVPIERSAVTVPKENPRIARESFSLMVDQVMKARGWNRLKATAAVVEAYPDLQDAACAEATNQWDPSRQPAWK